MGTPAQQVTSAPVQAPAATAAPAKNLTSTLNGRLIGPFEMNYTKTKEWFSAPATSENSVLAFAQKTAYVVVALVAGLFETLRNIGAGALNLAAFPINLIHGLLKSDKAEEVAASVEAVTLSVETSTAPVTPEAPAVAPARTAMQAVKDGLNLAKDSVKAGCSKAMSAFSSVYASARANPKTTAGVAVGAAAMIATGFYIVPTAMNAVNAMNTAAVAAAL